MSPCTSRPCPTPPCSTPSRRPTHPGTATLARLTEHVRALLPVDGRDVVTVDERRGTVERSAGWFADPKLSDGARPGRQPRARRARPRPRSRPCSSATGRSPAAPGRLGGGARAAGRRGRVARPRARPRRSGAPAAAPSVIACPLRTETGRGLGVLVRRLDAERPLRAADLRTVEVVADLAAMALERADLLEVQTPPRPRRAAGSSAPARRCRARSSWPTSTAAWWSTPRPLTGGDAGGADPARRARRRAAHGGDARPLGATAAAALASAACGEVARTRGPLLRARRRR